MRTINLQWNKAYFLITKAAIFCKTQFCKIK